MQKLPKSVTIAGSLSALSIAVLTGCASQPSTLTSPGPQTAAPSSAPSEATGSGAASPDSTAASGEYKDGSYSADGTYQSPNGTEKIGVSLTLADGVIESLDLTSYPSNPNTRNFQGQFIGGVNDLVVGKSIDEVSVDKVAGSSLTSGGFMDALEQIKAEAAG